MISTFWVQFFLTSGGAFIGLPIYLLIKNGKTNIPQIILFICGFVFLWLGNVLVSKLPPMKSKTENKNKSDNTDHENNIHEYTSSHN